MCQRNKREKNVRRNQEVYHCQEVSGNTHTEFLNTQNVPPIGLYLVQLFSSLMGLFKLLWGLHSLGSIVWLIFIMPGSFNEMLAFCIKNTRIRQTNILV